MNNMKPMLHKFIDIHLKSMDNLLKLTNSQENSIPKEFRTTSTQSDTSVFLKSHNEEFQQRQIRTPQDEITVKSPNTFP